MGAARSSFLEEQQIAAGKGRASVQWSSDNGPQVSGRSWTWHDDAGVVPGVVKPHDKMKLATVFMNEAWSRPRCLPALDEERGRSRALAVRSLDVRRDRMWGHEEAIRVMVGFAWRLVQDVEARAAAERGARA